MTKDTAGVGPVDHGVRPVAEVCAGSLRWHIPMPDHVPNVAWLSGVHYLYDQAALDRWADCAVAAERERCTRRATDIAAACSAMYTNQAQRAACSHIAHELSRDLL